MTSGPDAPSVEREQTDESLRTEREKTDRALAESQAAVEADADAVIEREPETTDPVLVEARESLSALATLLPLERVKTDRYLLTERLRSDNALSNRDDFLGIVSHDLRNLLGGIVMSAGLLAKMADSHEQGKQVLAGTARIQRYAARMNRLIGDLLDVASIDGGRFAVAMAPGDVAAVVDEAVEMFHGDAEARQLHLGTTIGQGPLIAAFDHDRLTQVLANLLSNAIKFTPPGGSIRVQVARSADVVEISVSDTGPGIPADMLDAVFQRFWQVKENDQRGLGLGLYISRSIVEAHGGAIHAESTPGKGSTFFVRLPARP